MGGGTSGQFSFPNAAGEGNPTAVYSTVSQAMHVLIKSLRGLSPYDGEIVPNPDEWMGTGNTWRTQERMDIHKAIVDALNGVDDFNSFVDASHTRAWDGTFPDLYDASAIVGIHTAERTGIGYLVDDAIAKAAEVLEAGTPFYEMRTAYENLVKRTFLRAMSRMAAGMADINAVNSSAFVFGMASIENEMQADVNRFAAQQGFDLIGQYVTAFTNTFRGHLQEYMTSKVTTRSGRDTMILDGVRVLTSLLSTNLQASMQTAHLQTEINRIRTVAHVEEFQTQMDMDVKDATWSLDVHQPLANFLSAAGGAAMVPPMMSKAQSVLGGAASGAAVGAATASIIPGVGTAVGAGIGAVVGAIAGAV